MSLVLLCSELTAEYAGTRKQFNRKLSDFGMIQVSLLPVSHHKPARTVAILFESLDLKSVKWTFDTNGCATPFNLSTVLCWRFQLFVLNKPTGTYSLFLELI